jgi:hypothetical protein
MSAVGQASEAQRRRRKDSPAAVGILDQTLLLIVGAAAVFAAETSELCQHCQSTGRLQVDMAADPPLDQPDIRRKYLATFFSRARRRKGINLIIQPIKNWIRSAVCVDRPRPRLLCVPAARPGPTSASLPRGAPALSANSPSDASHHPVHHALRPLTIRSPAQPPILSKKMPLCGQPNSERECRCLPRLG